MKQTVVFYMGFKSLDSICTRLRESGAPHDVPMCLVESATMSNERSFYGTLECMPELAKKHEVGDGGPVIIFMGPTAAFPASLQGGKIAASERPLKRLRVDLEASSA